MEKMSVKIAVIVMSLVICAVVGTGIVGAAITAPPTVTKTATPTDINVEGTGTDEVTTITITVTGAGGTTATSVPMDVVFALDCSGSMRGNDPSGLRKDAAKNFVDMMDSTKDQAGVVSWAGYVYFTQALTNDFPLVKSRIDAVGNSGSSTNLNAGLNGAIGVLDANTRTESSAEVILFLTDGLGTYTYAASGGPASIAASKGYVVYSIGLGSSVNVAALTDMADATGGKYYSSPTAANLQDIFDDILTEITTSTIPHNVDVVEVTQSYIVEEGSFNIAPDSVNTDPITDETEIIWLDIGVISDGDSDLSADETVTLTFEAKCNPCGADLDVDVFDDARVNYCDVDGNPAGYVPIPQAKINCICAVVADVDLCPDEYRWGNYNWDPFPDMFVGRQEVLFKNIGTGDAFDVIAKVTCVPTNVVASEPDVTVGDIPAGGSAWSSDTFELRTDMTNLQDPNKGICWRVEYDDAAGVHHVIENVAKFCGEQCSNICP